MCKRTLKQKLACTRSVSPPPSPPSHSDKHFHPQTHTHARAHTQPTLQQALECRRALTSAVSEAVQDVALVAEALEAAGVVDAGVVTGPLEGALVNVWRKEWRQGSVVVMMIKCYSTGTFFHRRSTGGLT